MSHESYNNQKNIIDRFERQIALLDVPSGVWGASRYARFSGKLSAWKADRGFGFIQKTSGEDIFIHVSNIIDFQPDYFTEGTAVEFVTEGERGPQAIKVVRANRP